MHVPNRARDTKNDWGRKAEIRLGEKYVKGQGASWPYDETGGKPVRRSMISTPLTK
jgi:hypothetical protein